MVRLNLIKKNKKTLHGVNVGEIHFDNMFKRFGLFCCNSMTFLCICTNVSGYTYDTDSVSCLETVELSIDTLD